MFLPDHLAHDVENEFTAYGFKYKSMAHWIVIQARAVSGRPFRHYFDKKIEDLDFESSTKEQLRGNIYLAKVTRVEPSLQAAFVEFGSEKKAFLPFDEIHPSYFKIPHNEKTLVNDSEKKHVTDEEKESKKHFLLTLMELL